MANEIFNLYYLIKSDKNVVGHIINRKDKEVKAYLKGRDIEVTYSQIDHVRKICERLGPVTEIELSLVQLDSVSAGKGHKIAQVRNGADSLENRKILKGRRRKNSQLPLVLQGEQEYREEENIKEEHEADELKSQENTFDEAQITYEDALYTEKAPVKVDGEEKHNEESKTQDIDVEEEQGLAGRLQQTQNTIEVEKAQYTVKEDEIEDEEIDEPAAKRMRVDESEGVVPQQSEGNGHEVEDIITDTNEEQAAEEAVVEDIKERTQQEEPALIENKKEDEVADEDMHTNEMKTAQIIGQEAELAEEVHIEEESKEETETASNMKEEAVQVEVKEEDIEEIEVHNKGKAEDAEKAKEEAISLGEFTQENESDLQRYDEERRIESKAKVEKNREEVKEAMKQRKERGEESELVKSFRKSAEEATHRRNERKRLAEGIEEQIIGRNFEEALKLTEEYFENFKDAKDFSEQAEKIEKIFKLLSQVPEEARGENFHKLIAKFFIVSEEMGKSSGNYAQIDDRVGENIGRLLQEDFTEEISKKLKTRMKDPVTGEIGFNLKINDIFIRDRLKTIAGILYQAYGSASEGAKDFFCYIVETIKRGEEEKAGELLSVFRETWPEYCGLLLGGDPLSPQLLRALPWVYNCCYINAVMNMIIRIMYPWIMSQETFERDKNGKVKKVIDLPMYALQLVCKVAEGEELSDDDLACLLEKPKQTYEAMKISGLCPSDKKSYMDAFNWAKGIGKIGHHTKKELNDIRYAKLLAAIFGHDGNFGEVSGVYTNVQNFFEKKGIKFPEYSTDPSVMKAKDEEQMIIASLYNEKAIDIVDKERYVGSIVMANMGLMDVLNFTLFPGKNGEKANVVVRMMPRFIIFNLGDAHFLTVEVTWTFEGDKYVPRFKLYDNNGMGEDVTDITPYLLQSGAKAAIVIYEQKPGYVPVKETDNLTIFELAYMSRQVQPFSLNKGVDRLSKTKGKWPGLEDQGIQLAFASFISNLVNQLLKEETSLRKDAESVEARFSIVIELLDQMNGLPETVRGANRYKVLCYELNRYLTLTKEGSVLREQLEQYEEYTELLKEIIKNSASVTPDENCERKYKVSYKIFDKEEVDVVNADQELLSEQHSASSTTAPNTPRPKNLGVATPLTNSSATAPNTPRKNSENTRPRTNSLGVWPSSPLAKPSPGNTGLQSPRVYTLWPGDNKKSNLSSANRDFLEWEGQSSPLAKPLPGNTGLQSPNAIKPYKAKSSLRSAAKKEDSDYLEYTNSSSSSEEEKDSFPFSLENFEIPSGNSLLMSVANYSEDRRPPSQRLEEVLHQEPIPKDVENKNVVDDTEEDKKVFDAEKAEEAARNILNSKVTSEVTYEMKNIFASFLETCNKNDDEQNFSKFRDIFHEEAVRKFKEAASTEEKIRIIRQFVLFSEYFNQNDYIGVVLDKNVFLNEFKRMSFSEFIAKDKSEIDALCLLIGNIARELKLKENELKENETLAKLNFYKAMLNLSENIGEVQEPKDKEHITAVDKFVQDNTELTISGFVKRKWLADKKVEVKLNFEDINDLLPRLAQIITEGKIKNNGEDINLHKEQIKKLRDKVENLAKDLDIEVNGKDITQLTDAIEVEYKKSTIIVAEWEKFNEINGTDKLEDLTKLGNEIANYPLYVQIAYLYKALLLFEMVREGKNKESLEFSKNNPGELANLVTILKQIANKLPKETEVLNKNIDKVNYESLKRDYDEHKEEEIDIVNLISSDKMITKKLVEQIKKKYQSIKGTEEKTSLLQDVFVASLNLSDNQDSKEIESLLIFMLSDIGEGNIKAKELRIMILNAVCKPFNVAEKIIGFVACMFELASQKVDNGELDILEFQRMMEEGEEALLIVKKVSEVLENKSSKNIEFMRYLVNYSYILTGKLTEITIKSSGDIDNILDFLESFEGEEEVFNKTFEAIVLSEVSVGAESLVKILKLTERVPKEQLLKFVDKMKIEIDEKQVNKNLIEEMRKGEPNTKIAGLYMLSKKEYSEKIYAENKIGIEEVVKNLIEQGRIDELEKLIKWHCKSKPMFKIISNVMLLQMSEEKINTLIKHFIESGSTDLLLLMNIENALLGNILNEYIFNIKQDTEIDLIKNVGCAIVGLVNKEKGEGVAINLLKDFFDSIFEEANLQDSAQERERKTKRYEIVISIMYRCFEHLKNYAEMSTYLEKANAIFLTSLAKEYCYMKWYYYLTSRSDKAIESSEESLRNLPKLEIDNVIDLLSEDIKQFENQKQERFIRLCSTLGYRYKAISLALLSGNLKLAKEIHAKKDKDKDIYSEDALKTLELVLDEVGNLIFASYEELDMLVQIFVEIKERFKLELIMYEGEKRFLFFYLEQISKKGSSVPENFEQIETSLLVVLDSRIDNETRKNASQSIRQALKTKSIDARAEEWKQIAQEIIDIDDVDDGTKFDILISIILRLDHSQAKELVEGIKNDQIRGITEKALSEETNLKYINKIVEKLKKGEQISEEEKENANFALVLYDYHYGEELREELPEVCTLKQLLNIWSKIDKKEDFTFEELLYVFEYCLTDVELLNKFSKSCKIQLDKNQQRQVNIKVEQILKNLELYKAKNLEDIKKLLVIYNFLFGFTGKNALRFKTNESLKSSMLQSLERLVYNAKQTIVRYRKWEGYSRAENDKQRKTMIENRKKEAEKEYDSLKLALQILECFKEYENFEKLIDEETKKDIKFMLKDSCIFLRLDTINIGVKDEMKKVVDVVKKFSEALEKNIDHQRPELVENKEEKKEEKAQDERERFENSLSRAKDVGRSETYRLEGALEAFKSAQLLSDEKKMSEVKAILKQLNIDLSKLKKDERAKSEQMEEKRVNILGEWGSQSGPKETQTGEIRENRHDDGLRLTDEKVELELYKVKVNPTKENVRSLFAELNEKKEFVDLVLATLKLCEAGVSHKLLVGCLKELKNEAEIIKASEKVLGALFNYEYKGDTVLRYIERIFTLLKSLGSKINVEDTISRFWECLKELEQKEPDPKHRLRDNIISCNCVSLLLLMKRMYNIKNQKDVEKLSKSMRKLWEEIVEKLEKYPDSVTGKEMEELWPIIGKYLLTKEYKSKNDSSCYLLSTRMFYVLKEGGPISLQHLEELIEMMKNKTIMSEYTYCCLRILEGSAAYDAQKLINFVRDPLSIFEGKFEDNEIDLIAKSPIAYTYMKKLAKNGNTKEIRKYAQICMRLSELYIMQNTGDINGLKDMGVWVNKHAGKFAANTIEGRLYSKIKTELLKTNVATIATAPEIGAENINGMLKPGEDLINRVSIESIENWVQQCKKRRRPDLLVEKAVWAEQQGIWFFAAYLYSESGNWMRAKENLEKAMKQGKVNVNLLAKFNPTLLKSLGDSLEKYFSVDKCKVEGGSLTKTELDDSDKMTIDIMQIIARSGVFTQEWFDLSGKLLNRRNMDAETLERIVFIRVNYLLNQYQKTLDAKYIEQACQEVLKNDKSIDPTRLTPEQKVLLDDLMIYGEKFYPYLMIQFKNARKYPSVVPLVDGKAIDMTFNINSNSVLNSNEGNSNCTIICKWKEITKEETDGQGNEKITNGVLLVSNNEEYECWDKGSKSLERDTAELIRELFNTWENARTTEQRVSLEKMIYCYLDYRYKAGKCSLNEISSLLENIFTDYPGIGFGKIGFLRGIFEFVHDILGEETLHDIMIKCIFSSNKRESMKSRLIAEYINFLTSAERFDIVCNFAKELKEMGIYTDQIEASINVLLANYYIENGARLSREEYLFFASMFEQAGLSAGYLYYLAGDLEKAIILTESYLNQLGTEYGLGKTKADGVNIYTVNRQEKPDWFCQNINMMNAVLHKWYKIMAGREVPAKEKETYNKRALIYLGASGADKKQVDDFMAQIGKRKGRKSDEGKMKVSVTNIQSMQELICNFEAIQKAHRKNMEVLQEKLNDINNQQKDMLSYVSTQNEIRNIISGIEMLKNRFATVAYGLKQLKEDPQKGKKELDEKYEQLIKNLNQKYKNDKKNKKENYEKELENLNRVYKQGIKEMEQKYEKDKEEKKKNYEEKRKELKKSYAKELEKLNKSYSEELEEQNKSYEKDLKKLDQSYAEELEQQNKSYKEKLEQQQKDRKKAYEEIRSYFKEVKKLVDEQRLDDVAGVKKVVGKLDDVSKAKNKNDDNDCEKEIEAILKSICKYIEEQSGKEAEVLKKIRDLEEQSNTVTEQIRLEQEHYRNEAYELSKNKCVNEGVEVGTKEVDKEELEDENAKKVYDKLNERYGDNEWPDGLKDAFFNQRNKYGFYCKVLFIKAILERDVKAMNTIHSIYPNESLSKTFGDLNNGLDFAKEEVQSALNYYYSDLLLNGKYEEYVKNFMKEVEVENKLVKTINWDEANTRLFEIINWMETLPTLIEKDQLKKNKNILKLIQQREQLLKSILTCGMYIKAEGEKQFIEDTIIEAVKTGDYETFKRITAGQTIEKIQELFEKHAKYIDDRYIYKKDTEGKYIKRGAINEEDICILRNLAAITKKLAEETKNEELVNKSKEIYLYLYRATGEKGYLKLCNSLGGTYYVVSNAKSNAKSDVLSDAKINAKSDVLSEEGVVDILKLEGEEFCESLEGEIQQMSARDKSRSYPDLVTMNAEQKNIFATVVQNVSSQNERNLKDKNISLLHRKQLEEQSTTLGELRQRSEEMMQGRA